MPKIVYCTQITAQMMFVIPILMRDLCTQMSNPLLLWQCQYLTSEIPL